MCVGVWVLIAPEGITSEIGARACRSCAGIFAGLTDFDLATGTDFEVVYKGVIYAVGGGDVAAVYATLPCRSMCVCY